MTRPLAGALALATAFVAATILTTPPATASKATTATKTAIAPAGETAATTVAKRTVAPLAASARRHLIRTKIYWGRCKDTCRVKVRIKNISRKRLYSVSLTAKLRVNGRSMGSCRDYVGQISPRGTRWAACTVRSNRLNRLWDRYLDGEIRWDTRVNTVVHYRYYS
ncbi:hypothetical protein [Nonomuraea typhae]|uniref:hypothetical protein n=1 Tax=Nonomuraea typhae TaxID=2603600 RepID=UPI0012F80962|nr:hypothetical protein [Nonomuraea typhae]